jgi:hypothetical protein
MILSNPKTTTSLHAQNVVEKEKVVIPMEKIKKI